ncbi:MAG: SdpI family protein [Spirochaetia bacterium]|nr:SdpI family protein [Spirochaetia bacterium]MCF7952494.1 SdpI family protein [Spirochaetales bacterium]
MIKKMGYMVLIIPVLISLAATIGIYPQLPEMLPAQWNGNGSHDTYNPKFYIFFTALLPMLALFFMKKVPTLHPAHENFKKHKKAYNTIIGLFILFLIGIHWITILSGLGYSLNTNFLIKTIVGIIFLSVSSFLPNTEYEYSFGIRTPWTLASRPVWNKTHAMAGKLFLAVGIVFLITAFIPSRISVWVGTCSLIITIITLYVFSFAVHRRIIKKQKKENKQ